MSRCKLLREGDRNTKYFHTLATIRRRRNLILTVKKDDITLTEPTQVRKAFVQHFKQMYASQETVLFDLTSLGLHKLSTAESSKLEEPVTLEEVKEALLSCDVSKAPGYDGFNINCLKHVWQVIGEEFS